MGFSTGLAEARATLARGNFEEAIPVLRTLVDDFEGVSDPVLVGIIQDTRFLLAGAYYKIGDTRASMLELEVYLANKPCRKKSKALQMMSQGLSEVGEWKRVIELSRTLLDLSNVSMNEKVNANMLMGRALFRLEQWGPCIAPLTFAEARSRDEAVRQSAQVMIVRALLEAKKWDKLVVWIPQIYRTDAKYDISMNLTTMQAAQTLFDRGDLLHAVHLYRMVLPREELIRFSKKRLDQLLKQLGEDEINGVSESLRTKQQKKINLLERSIKELSGLPPYENEVALRIGKVYREFKRYWEAYVFFDMLFEKDPDSAIGAASLIDLVSILYELQEVDRAEKRITSYLDERIEGAGARTLLWFMMQHNLEKKNGAKVAGLRKYLDRLPPPAEKGQGLLQGNLHYMMGFAYLFVSDFKHSEEQFGTVISDFPEHQRVPDAHYYQALARMMGADYQNAFDAFELYREKYGDGEYFSEATFRQGICLLGLDKSPEAEATFIRFIETYPTDRLVANAYSMRGDIEAAKDGEDDPHTLDRALADYREAIEKSVTLEQAAYATFQSAKVYELEEKWPEIVDLMSDYLELKRVDIDVAQAMFWMGKARMSMGRVDEAVDDYLDTILKFGNSPEQNGVDQIISELVSLATYRLNDEARRDFMVKLTREMADLDPEAEVAMLRLEMTVAMIEGEDATRALAGRLLAEKKYKMATPITLAVLCDVAVEEGDTEQMGRLFDYFMENFAESDKLWVAYRAKAYQLVAAGDSAAVTNLIGEVQDRYGADSFMGWSEMLKGDTLFKMGMYDEAETAYYAIQGVSAWRGPLHAESMYGMGQCRLAKQDLEGAHAFFQRTYLIFKAHDGGKWAAKGYLAAAECLLKLNREEDAVKTWQEMIENEYVNTLPEAETAREMIRKYGNA